MGHGSRCNKRRVCVYVCMSFSVWVCSRAIVHRRALSLKPVAEQSEYRYRREEIEIGIRIRTGISQMKADKISGKS